MTNTDTYSGFEVIDISPDEIVDETPKEEVKTEAADPQLTLVYPQSIWQAILNELGKSPYVDVANFLPAMVANLSAQLKKPEEPVK